MTRFLLLTSFLIVFLVPHGASAQVEPESEELMLREVEILDAQTRKQEQRHSLQAARLSVAVAALDVPALAIWGSLWLVIASDQSDPTTRRGLYALGSIQITGAVANIAWLFFAGQTLRDYKDGGRKWMTVRRARLDTAMSGVDTALRVPGITIGSLSLIRNRDDRHSFDRRAGLILLIPELALLPFNIWALVINARELGHRKRARTTASARRIQPIASGFRF